MAEKQKENADNKARLKTALTRAETDASTI
jgi:hypothetical protein